MDWLGAFQSKKAFRDAFCVSSPLIGRTMDWRSPLWLEERLLALTKWPRLGAKKGRACYNKIMKAHYNIEGISEL